MIPPYISPDVKSTGERQIFELFKKDPETHGWIVLHSLCLSKHTKRLYGEIDFVVLAPELGIFCLEVKSGRIKREKGVWIYTNRFGESSSSTRSPFEQAKEGMFALLEVIKNKFGERSHLSKLVFGFGVIFPHIMFDVASLEYEQEQIYDRDSRREPISEFIKILSKYTINKVKDCKWFNENESLPTNYDISKLVDFFRGDFERLATLQQRITDIEEQLNSYTAEQYKCLDQLQDNDRCLFQGAAGTGKTLIAIESVNRLLSDGKRVLFLCFNSLLGIWLRSCLQESDNLVINSFHKFLKSFSDIPDKFSGKNDDYFKFELPLMALDSIDRGVISLFDNLVIDEGQDLIIDEYLDVFDSLLKGGMLGGKWKIFCDFEKQAIFSEYSTSETMKILEKRALFARFRLTINCRNTKPVSEEIALITGFEEPPFLPTNIEGNPVQYHFYKDKYEETEILKNILHELKNKNILPGEITILSPYSYKKSVVSNINTQQFPITNLSKSPQSFPLRQSVTFSTIQGFKGLENSFIIITDISQLRDKEYKSLLYVGMSRAKCSLYMLLSSVLKNTYKKIIKKGLKICENN